MTSPRTPRQRTFEAVARLEITENGSEAQLSAQSPKTDADLVLFGKGDGKVYVNGTTGKEPVLTPQNLADAIADGVEVEVLNALIDTAIANTQFAQDVLRLQLAIIEGITGITPPLGGPITLNTMVVNSFRIFVDKVAAVENAVFGDLQTAVGAIAEGILGNVGAVSNVTPAAIAAALANLAGGGGGAGDGAVAASLKAFFDGITKRTNATAVQAVAVIDNVVRESEYNAEAIGLWANALVPVAVTDQAAEAAAVLAGLVAGGAAVDEPAVNALIGAALAAMIMPILDDHTRDIAGLNTKLATVQALVANLVGEIAGIVASTDGCGFNNEAVNTLILEGVRPTAETIQRLIDILGGKPDGGANIEDVAATFAALGEAIMGAVGIEEAAINALIVAALADLDLSAAGLDEAAVIELLQEQLAALGPMIQEAIQNNASKLGDRLTLNTKGAADGKVTIQSNNLDGAQWKIDLDLELQRDGVLTVNGKRVLTVDDLAAATGLDVDALKAFLQTDVNSANGIIGKELVVIEKRLEDEETLRDTQTKALEQGIQFLITNKADQAQHQGLINALCSAPFTSMTGNTVNNLAKVGAWVGIVKQEIENLEANLKFAYDKTVENKTDIAALKATVENKADKTALQPLQDGINNLYGQLDVANTLIQDLSDVVVLLYPLLDTVENHGERITTLEGAALSGGGITQTVVDSLLARLDALEAENATLKTELTKKADKSALSATDLRVQSISDANGFLQNNLISLSETVDGKADKTQLAAYAKLNDGNQEFTAGLIKAAGVQFSLSDEVLVPIEFPDYGKRLAVVPKGSQDLDDAGIVVVHTDLADLASGDVTSAQLSQAISTVQAPIEDLVRRTKNLTDDGTMSTLHVLGDGFRDENDNPTHSSLYEGLQFLIDALYSVADGSGAFSTGNTIVTMFEALTAAFSASGGGKDLGISVLQTANGPVLTTANGIIQTADQTAHGSREIIRLVNVLNNVLNTVSGRVDTLMGRPPGRSFADAEWEPCNITFNGAAGGIDVTEIDGFLHLRGGLSTNAFRTAINNGSFLGIGKLPGGVTRPEVPALVPVWGILTGSSYRIAVIRIGTDGVISVSGPTGAIDGFDVTGVCVPAGGFAARSMGAEDLTLLDAGGDGEQFNSIDDLEERLQLFMDAIDGPDATPEKMQQTFWLINDVLSRLLEGAGMQITGGRSITPELAEEKYFSGGKWWTAYGEETTPPEAAPRQVFAQGIDPETPVPKSYLMGLVIGLTTTKLNKLLSLDLIPSFKQGSSIMIKPADVAAAMETAGMYSEAEETQYAQAAEIVIED